MGSNGDSELVPEHLKAKNDGRKKAWWVKKIEELEGELSAYKNGAHSSTSPEASLSQEIPGTNESYASGFIDCMHKFQILSKVQRGRLRQEIVRRGPGAVKNMRSAKFRGMSL